MGFIENLKKKFLRDFLEFLSGFFNSWWELIPPQKNSPNSKRFNLILYFKIWIFFLHTFQDTVSSRYLLKKSTYSKPNFGQFFHYTMLCIKHSLNGFCPKTWKVKFRFFGFSLWNSCHPIVRRPNCGEYVQIFKSLVWQKFLEFWAKIRQECLSETFWSHVVYTIAQP